MEEDMWADLPDDPDEAFAIYEKRAQKLHTSFDVDSGYEHFDKEGYLCDIIGFIQSYGIEIGIDTEIPYDEAQFEYYFNTARNKVRIYAAKVRTDAVRKKKQVISPSYVIDLLQKSVGFTGYH